MDPGQERQYPGDIAGLARAMRQGKQVYPPAVYPAEGGLVLVAGRRRWAAHRLNGEEKVPVWVLRTWGDLLLWLELDVAHDTTAAKPMALSEVVDFADFAMRIFRPTRSIKPETQIAEHFGVLQKNMSYVRSVRRQWIDAEVPTEVRAYALKQIKAANFGEMAAHTAYERTKRFADSLKPKQSMSAPDQVHRLQVAVSTLSGVATGLREIGEISEYLDPVTCKQFADALRDPKVEIEKTIRALRARVATGESE